MSSNVSIGREALLEIVRLIDVLDENESELTHEVCISADHDDQPHLIGCVAWSEARVSYAFYPGAFWKGGK